MKPGDSIPVQVSTIGPMHFDRLGHDPGSVFFAAWFFGVVLPIAIGWSVVTSLLERSRQGLLIQIGQPALARVIRFGPRSFRIGPSYGATYEFVLPTGRRHRGVIAAGPKPGPQTQVGASILVLYDPDRPGTNMPYDAIVYAVGPSASSR
jgi:hypothetical protein